MLATEKCNKQALGRNYVNKHKGCLLQEMKKMLPNLHHYEISDVYKGKLEHSMILQEKESKRKIAKSFQNLGGKFSAKKVEDTRRNFYSFLSERMLSEIGGEALHAPTSRLVISASELLLICVYASNSLFIHYELSYEPKHHCKKCFKYVQEGVNDCYSALYAIEKFKIVVYDCSHLLCSKHNGSIMPFHKCQKHLLTVQKNCVLVFCGGHIHGGAAFGHNEGKRHRLVLCLVPDGMQH